MNQDIYVSYFIKDSFMLHLKFALDLHEAKKSYKDSQVSTRLFDSFHLICFMTLKFRVVS